MTDYSRTLLLGEKSTSLEAGDLRSRIERCRVLITADVETSVLEATLKVLIGDLRRLPVQLQLDPDGGSRPLPDSLVQDLVDLTTGIDPDRGLSIGFIHEPTIWVHVGRGDAGALVRGVPDGHGTRLRPQGEAFPAVSAGTGLGAVVTGSFLAAEAFKLIVGVAQERCRPVRSINFCPVTLGEPSTVSAAPLVRLRGVALIGGGAIGTAIALILRELNAEGELTVVDPETFDDPNVTTYSLGAKADADQKIAKVDLVARECCQLVVHRKVGTARDYLTAIESGELPMPTVVLGAVDTIDARHEIAALHADVTLDGSTGGATGSMLSLAECRWDGPCLRCYYPNTNQGGPSTEQAIADATGLPLELLGNGDAILSIDEVEALSNIDDGLRERLQDHVGKPICGLGRALGLTGRADGFNPSASFVAQQAAALVVGALIRRSTTLESAPISVQYDALFGPHSDMAFDRRAQPSCRCLQDIDLHRVVRAKRNQIAARDTSAEVTSQLRRN